MSADALREAWLDGSLDDAGCAELVRQAEADPALAAGLAESARLDLLLGLAYGRRRDLAPGVMAGLRGQESRTRLRRQVMRHVRRPSRGRYGLWLLAAAAALVAAMLLLPERAPAALGAVAEAGADATVQGAAAASGMPLRAGDRVRSGSAPLRLDACAAAIVLAPGGELELAPDRIRLHAGSLRAEVRPHPSASPLVFATAGATATVLGTILSLEADGGRTRLAVERGRVALQDGSGPATTVAAGGWAVADGRGVVRTATPLFPSGLAGWVAERGAWTAEGGIIHGGAAQARSRLASAQSYGDLELSCRLRVQGAQAAEVQLADYSWFAEVPAGGWREVRVRLAGGRATGSVDGAPVAMQAGRPDGALAAGPIAFYVRDGGRVEIAEAMLVAE